MRKVKKAYERTRVQTSDLIEKVNKETGEIYTEKRKSMTQQHHVKNTNINQIMKRFERTGVLPVRTAQPLSGPIPDVESFHEAMNIVVKGRQMFEGLPSNIREHFGNSPEAFLAAFQDENQHDKLRELKLMAPKPVEPPAAPPAAPAEPPPAG